MGTIRDRRATGGSHQGRQRLEQESEKMRRGRVTSAEVVLLCLANASLMAQIRRNRKEYEEMRAVAQATIDHLRHEVAELEIENLELNSRLGEENVAAG